MNQDGQELVQAMIKCIGMDAAPQVEGDYFGSDGLLYCGKCNTPKQTRRTLPPMLGGGEKILPCTCKCQEEEYQENERRKKDREDQRTIDRLRSESFIDEKARLSTFDNFQVIPENKRLYAIAKKYAAEFDRMLEENQGLLFYGEPGTGKTFAATCIINYLLDRKVPAFTTSFVKLLNQIMKGYDFDAESYLHKINKAKVLLIDDLGTERGTDFALERIYDVLDSRYRSNKPVILTSNLSIAQMKSETNDRLKKIYDRVFENCYPVHVTGGSWRQKKAADRFDRMTQFFNEGID